jgi:hypothetical protein
MSINFKSVFEFSHYVDTDNILISQEKVPNNRVPKHRFSLYVPYKRRKSGPVATVIMYNPSKAGLKNEQGRIVSDFTIYNILQYLYHHKYRFKAVRIMNLFSSYSSNPTKLSTSSLNHSSNNKTLKIRISKVNHERGDKLILAWGNPPKSASTKIKTLYNKQIAFLESIIRDQPVFHVEDCYRKSHTPQHGSRWTDYEELKPYQF